MSALRSKDDNFFSVPGAMSLAMPLGLVTFAVSGLRPKTRYKIMLNNHPNEQFEDIQHTARPVGDHVKNNPREGGQRTYPYLITDASGSLQFVCNPFGSDGIEFPGAPTDEPVSAQIWRLFKNRTAENDAGRHKVVAIEYSQINSPASADKIKTVKFTYLTDANTGNGIPSGGLPQYYIADCTLVATGKNDRWAPIEIRGSFYQTFYVNSKTVGGAPTVDITDFILYLRRKPSFKSNKSGIEGPGIRLKLMECNADGSPNTFKGFADGNAFASWHECKASPLAATGTRFEFNSPVTVATNRSYAIAVEPLDEDYVFWFSQKGDLLLVNGNRTERRSAGSSKEHQGDFYPARTSTTPGADGSLRERAWQPDPQLDLKFDVNIAEYTLGDVSMNLVNDNYEFIQFDDATGDNWYPGETIYKQNTPLAGTASIAAGTKLVTGSGTDFTSLADGDKVVIVDSVDDTQVQVFTVDESVTPVAADKFHVREYSEAVLSGSLMNTVVAAVETYDIDFNFMRARNSSVNVTQYNADNSMRFAAGDVVRGVISRETGTVDFIDNLDISTFRSDFNGKIPAEFDFKAHYKFSQITSGTIQGGNAIFSIDTNEPNMYVNAPNRIDYQAMIASKSLEVDQASNLINPSEDSKSGLINFAFTYKGANTIAYSVPAFSIDEMQIIAHRWRINNDNTNEHTNNGNSETRHISKTLKFGGKQAEDIRVILNGYRPRQTEIEVYAKIINADDSDSFDDKFWTKLSLIAGADAYSYEYDKNDYIEYEYTFPKYPDSDTTVDGVFTSTLDSATLTTTTANVASFTPGQVIKFYSPLFEDSYGIFSIQSANNTSGEIVLNEAIANSSIVGSGFKIDTLKTENTAFRNMENDQIVRYFGTNGESYDNYEAVAIKILLLSEDRKLAPKVDDYRVIGVSA